MNHACEMCKLAGSPAAIDGAVALGAEGLLDLQSQLLATRTDEICACCTEPISAVPDRLTQGATTRWVTFRGLPALPLDESMEVQGACTLIDTPRSCFEYAAAVALNVYAIRTWPIQTRFSAAALTLRGFAAAHKWTPIGPWRYPCTIRWFALNNTPERLAVVLAEHFDDRPLSLEA